MKKKVYYKLNRYQVTKVEVETAEQEQAVKMLNREMDRFNDKKDEKFSRRINYLAKNLVVVLKAMAISDGDTYLLKNYMVTNKVFVADIKKIDFEIITFDELKKLIGE